jgi:uncharacterized membrane protein YbhN (UPF0104 family)
VLSHAPRHQLALLAGGSGLAALFSLLLLVSPFHARFAGALPQLDTANPGLVTLSVLAFAASACCACLAWHSGLAGAGAPLSRRECAALYLVGTLVNSLVPFRAGGAVRLALFARASGSARVTAGVAAAIGSARLATLVGLVALGSLSLPIPLWSIAPLAAAAAGAGAVASICVRGAGGLGAVSGWVLGAAVARVASASCLAAAFGAPSPLVVGPAIVAAVELAGTLPLTPGNVVLSSAAVSFVLEAHGVASATALAAGITMASSETVTSLVLGALGAVELARRGVPVAARLRRQRPTQALPLPAEAAAVPALQPAA